MIETKIYAHLSTTTAITASVSTRIWPMTLPDNPTYPAITYERISSNPQFGLSGYASLDNPIITIDCWTTSYDQAKTLSTRVHAAMDSAGTFKANLLTDNDDYNPDLQIYRVVQDYSCWSED